jgi:hypothetical protein
MATTLSVGAFVHRSCGKHGSYATRAADPKGCPACAKNARRQVGAGLICGECGTRLLWPAPICNWCDESFDLEAALAAELDNEMGPGRSTATGPATPREN